MAKVNAHLQRDLFTVSNGCSETTRRACVVYLQSVPTENYLTLGRGNRCLHNRQLLLGNRVTTRAIHAPTLPPCFVQLGKEARASLLASTPLLNDTDIPEEPMACAVNRYPVSDPVKGRGSQLGFHQDRGNWRELVIGVTLGPEDWREMRFLHKPTKTMHKLRTEAGDVYLFRNAMYTDWHHASMKRSSKQKRTIYSVTFRWSRDAL